MLSRRKSLDQLTKPELIDLGRSYGVDLTMSMTKTGMISRLMGKRSAEEIRTDVEYLLSMKP